jgi:hypothetical protein
MENEVSRGRRQNNIAPDQTLVWTRCDDLDQAGMIVVGAASGVSKVNLVVRLGRIVKLNRGTLHPPRFHADFAD